MSRKSIKNQAISRVVFTLIALILINIISIRIFGRLDLTEKGLFTLSRRQVRKRIRALFGRHIGGFAHGPFNLEAKGHFLLDLDPGGDGCALITGLSQAVLSRNLRRPVKVTHTSCEARKQELCRWVVSDSD